MEENNVVKKKRTGLKIFLGILLVLLIAAAGFVIYAVQQESMYDEKSKEIGTEYISKKVVSEKAKNNPEIAKIEEETFKELSKEDVQDLGDGIKMKMSFNKDAREVLVKLEDNSEEQFMRYYLVDGFQMTGDKKDTKELEEDWKEMIKIFKDMTGVFNSVGIEKFSVVIKNPYNDKKEILRMTDGKVIYDFHNDLKKNKNK